MPPIGVLTPEALFTALLLRDPVPGNAWTKELPIFDIPIAISSCVASTDFPVAEIKVKPFLFVAYNKTILIFYVNS